MKQKNTNHSTIQTMIKMEPKEYERNSKTSYDLYTYLLIMIETLLLRPSLHFTTLVDTSLLPI